MRKRPSHIPAGRQSRSARAAIIVATVAIYALLFVPAYMAVGVIAGSLSVVPIAVAGWLLGRKGGLLAGLISIPLHILLFTIGGQAGWQVVVQEWPGSLMGIILGGAAGWLSEFLGRVQRQAQELERERAALAAEIAVREQIQRDLQQAKAPAEAASRAKSAFLANISHELRTPLSAIIGYSELLQMQAPALTHAELVSDLLKIQTAGAHLLALIDKVLDLSKIEASKLTLAPETFDISTLVRDVATTIAPLLKRNGNRLDLRCADDLGSMYADSTRVRQVLLNLLGNAVKFTQHGLITLEVLRVAAMEEAQAVIDSDAPGSVAYRPASWIRFQVSDTGIGMTSEQLAKLFQPFAEINAEATRIYGGTGLGLALSRHLCQLMGGDITVTSVHGGGSTFTAHLPANLDDPSAEAAIHPIDVREDALP